MCFLYLSLIVSWCFYSYILDTYDSLALGGKGGTGGVGIWCSLETLNIFPKLPLRSEGRVPSGIGRGSPHPGPHCDRHSSPSGFVWGHHSGQPGPWHSDDSSWDDIKSPYWIQNLLVKSIQNQPWEQVEDKLMNTIFSFKLCCGGN